MPISNFDVTHNVFLFVILFKIKQKRAFKNNKCIKDRTYWQNPLMRPASEQSCY